MARKLMISVSPHIKSPLTTQKIMLDVIIALIPALIASVYFFGLRALIVTLFCIGVSVVAQYLFELLCKRDIEVGDLSAVVTGMLLGFNLPVTIPLWQAAIGSVFAIIVVKELFGGIGHNFANPAITARIMMLLSFSGTMTNWARLEGAELVAGATPLAALKEGATKELPSLLDMFLGNIGGSLGETSALALIIGGVYLVARRVIKWHTPVCFVATVFVGSLLYSGFDVNFALYQILSGGLMLGAIFMATDYSTTPPTPLGKVVFGIGCGLITLVIRLWGTNPEGVSYAILLMNILAPYISKLTRHKIFGAKKITKGGAAA